MSQMLQSLLTGFGIWSHQRLWNSSEKTIKQYYEHVDRSTLSKDLVDVLGKLGDDHGRLRQIFKQDAATDEGGVLYWEEDIFRKWVTTNQPLSIISALVPTLWRIFVYFAGFPFTERILNDFEGSAPQHQRVDEDGFVRAHKLLALGGVEFLGGTKDGWTWRGGIEKSWSQKSPRLAKLMFDGLKISATEVDERFQGVTNSNLTDCAEEQLMDAIVLTQPEPYMTGLPLEQDLREAAKRLLADNVAPDYENTSSFAVSKDDLQNLIQLFLLLRIGNTPWKRGLMRYDNQMNGDLENAAIVSDQEEILRSARVANALIQHTLGSVDSIAWQSFETVCKTYPTTVLRFYQLWTTICVGQSATSPPQNLGSGPSNCVVQFLSLIGPAVIDAPMPVGAGFNLFERQLQLDLQNATLVADSTSTPVLDESKLVERLANDKWFHILILSAEEANGTASTESTERLITLFTSPHDKEMVFQNSPGGDTYVWRHGLVQLLPHILTSQTGGLGASLQHDAIKFSPHSDPKHKSSSVTVDLRNGTVMVEWTGTPSLRLKLKSLKCYHLAGTAVKFYRSP